jgi:hypothetical protein
MGEIWTHAGPYVIFFLSPCFLNTAQLEEIVVFVKGQFWFGGARRRVTSNNAIFEVDAITGEVITAGKLPEEKFTSVVLQLSVR